MFVYVHVFVFWLCSNHVSIHYHDSRFETIHVVKLLDYLISNFIVIYRILIGYLTYEMVN